MKIQRTAISPIPGLLRLVTLVTMLGFGIAGCGSGQETGRPEAAFVASEVLLREGKEAYEKEHYLEAIRKFEEVRIQSPNSSDASEAMFLLAQSRYQVEQFSSAAVDFKSFRNRYPTHALAPRAQYLAGESYYNLSPKSDLDQSYTIYAVNEYQSFLRDFPAAETQLKDSAQQRITELREKLAQKSFLAAELYVKIEEFKSAVIYFERVIDQYYDTQSAAEAQLRIAEVQQMRNHTEEARTALRKFEDKYLQTASQEIRTRAMELKAKL